MVTRVQWSAIGVGLAPSAIQTAGRPRAVAVSALVILLCGGCTDRITDPGVRRAAEPLLRADAVEVRAGAASVRWNAITRDFIANATPKPNQQVTLRAFAYLSLAQYRAVIAAQEDRDRNAMQQGAVATASAVVLSALLPAGATIFESQLQLQKSEAARSSKTQRAFAAGAAVGREVAAEIIERAQSDRFDAVWTGTVPTGPGYWSSDLNPPGSPLLPRLGEMRPFFMRSGDQFRPDAPPAFGTQAFRDALAEVRRFSDNQTAEQLRIAQFWAMTTGSLVAGFWNEEAANRIVRYHLNERRAARALAIMNMAAMDANIACHDAKYTYWLIRPYRADPAIATPIGRPQHPSYPSNHACVSGAAAFVLAAIFPADARELRAMADEAGESRLYAGIHYRFDKDAGLRIARRVTALALRRDGEDGEDGKDGERSGDR